MLKAYKQAIAEGGVVKAQFNEVVNTFSYLDNKVIENYAYNVAHFSKEEAN